MVSAVFSAAPDHKTKGVFQFPGITLPSFPLIQVIKELSLQSQVKQRELGFELQGSASHIGSEGSLSELPTHLPL